MGGRHSRHDKVVHPTRESDDDASLLEEDIKLNENDSEAFITPEFQLLKYVLENDVDNIETLVKRTKDDLLNAQYGDPYNKNILYIACYEEAEKINANTIQKLIELGANLFYSDESDDSNKAIHYAAKGLNPDILGVILEKLDDYQINATNSGGDTAINLLIKEGNVDHDNYKKCFEKLIVAGVDINITDIEGVPPIYWALKNKNTIAIEELLKHSHIDLDTYINCGKTARDLINELKINIPGFEPIINNRNELTGLFELVKTGNEDNFINCHPLNKDILDDDKGQYTLLQLATRKCLSNIVKCLLENGASPNKTTEETTETPILIAAENGFYKIFELLVKHPNTIIPKDVPSELLSKIYDNNEVSSEIDYTKCLEYLTVTIKDNIAFNDKDRHGNYALHYAARYGGPDLALQLLNAGASLANRNNYGSLTIEDIDYDTLKQHLDSCIVADPDNILKKEKMTMSFRYKTLMPSTSDMNSYSGMYQNYNDVDVEENHNLLTYRKDKTDLDLIPETDVLCFMSKSNELKDLLKHPLITSFLYLKWRRISWVFYIKILLYLLFSISLICFIKFAYIDEAKTFGSGWSIFLLFFFVLLTFRELFKMLVSPKKYFIYFENWVEMILTIILACMLFISDVNKGTRNQFCAIIILVAAFEFILLIGQHPLLSTNIVMLRRASLNFFKFLLSYSILIIAFALSFYMLFNDIKNNNKKDDIDNGTNSSKHASDEEENSSAFTNPIIAIFKTVVMLTGELEASNIVFDANPIISRVIFIVFVFTIPIILLNLLNGLAVSDTQTIKNDAELFGYIALAGYISHAEAMLLAFNKMPNCLKNLYNRWCSYTSNNNINKINKLTRLIVQQLCLFPNFLQDYTLTIFPNQRGKIDFKGKKQSVYHFPIFSSLFGCKHLDIKSVRMARALIHVKNDDAKREKQLQDRRQKEDLLVANQIIIMQRLQRLENILNVQ